MTAIPGAPRDLYWRSDDGLRLHARDYPGGDARPPILCLHGLTRNARDFEEVAPAIAGLGHRVLAVDMRGRGRSDWDPRARYTPAVYAADVRGLLADQRIARAVFVGTSMGGLVTMELAALAPEAIAAAVINDVGPVLGAAGLARIAGYVGKPAPIAGWADAADYARRHNAHAFPHHAPADWERMARRLFREREGVVALDYDPAIARPFTAAPAAPPDPWGRWEALVAAAPVLLLRGALSDLLEAAVAARMVEGRAGATLVEVPGVGHAPMLDEPAARAAIGRFLAGLHR